MASAFESLLTIILFTLLVKGHSQCSVEDITVAEEAQAGQIQGKREWKVTFINNCNCPQQDLKVSCEGFQSTEKVDPNIFAPVGNNQCLVNSGRTIAPFKSVEFFYAWDPPFIFTPVSSQANC